MIRSLLFIIIYSCVFTNLIAQDDLLSELEEDLGGEKQYTIATFKGTRLINGHTVKTREKGELEFLISHRFGAINTGAYEFFGLDDSYMHLTLDYGVTDRLNVGLGRSSLDKTYDSFVKYKLLRQVNSGNGSPVTVTALINTSVKTSTDAFVLPNWTTVNRMAYASSILIARKFSSSFSMQLMPVWVHKNRVASPDVNNTYALGTGFRVMLTSSISLNGEYYFRLNAPDFPDSPRYNSMALGVDIETGGHVFQLQLTNSRGMIERAFITETTGSVGAGDINIGFNISRTFQLKH